MASKPVRADPRDGEHHPGAHGLRATASIVPSSLAGFAGRGPRGFEGRGPSRPEAIVRVPSACATVKVVGRKLARKAIGPRRGRPQRVAPTARPRRRNAVAEPHRPAGRLDPGPERREAGNARRAEATVDAAPEAEVEATVEATAEATPAPAVETPASEPTVTASADSGTVRPIDGRRGASCRSSREGARLSSPAV